MGFCQLIYPYPSNLAISPILYSAKHLHVVELTLFVQKYSKIINKNNLIKSKQNKMRFENTSFTRTSSD